MNGFFLMKKKKKTWLGKDEGEATWENIEDIRLHFSETDLEDKVNVMVGSNVEIDKPVARCCSRS